MPLLLHIDGRALSLELAEQKAPAYGRPYSLLALALSQGQRIAHHCGGVGQCSTCHVYVTQGLEHCSPPTPQEAQRLNEVYARRPESRLACQCVVQGGEKIVIETP